MDYHTLVRSLDELLRETFLLWDPGWVTFNWRGYTYDHTQRVRGLAVTLCCCEGGDETVTELAALLHDISKPYDGAYIVDVEGKRIVDERGYWKNEPRLPVRSNAVTRLYDELGLAGKLHNESGAILATHVLRARGVDDTTCERVARTIRDHLRPPEGRTLESACLYDADTIDANIGLPAFVRNIYINLHFHDARKRPETPPLDALLRDHPMGFLEPYVLDNLPRWVGGKRRDFVPRLLTGSARALSMARLERLERVFADLAQEVRDQDNGQSRLDVVRHFVQHREDPSISAEAESLANRLSREGAPSDGRRLVEQIQRELAGLE